MKDTMNRWFLALGVALVIVKLSGPFWQTNFIEVIILTMFIAVGLFVLYRYLRGRV